MKPLDTAVNFAPMPDVQSSRDERRLAIDKVGICDLRHPLQIRSGSDLQHTVATVAMYVNLPHDAKGTHMSRFVDLLNRYNSPLDEASFGELLSAMVQRLEAESGYIELRFPFFISKTAPVSGLKSLLDYQLTLRGEIHSDAPPRVTVEMVVPVTSLCPCSKEISAYGAHNQRSHITVAVRTRDHVPFHELAQIVESQGSCELYGLLKRTDEKLVTERAYENPKFVEDIVRDVAARLQSDDRIRYYRVEVENFESIHNHSAYALIENDKERRD